jgi:hypothetical protein
MPPEMAAIAALARRAAREPVDGHSEPPDPKVAGQDVAIMCGRIREWGVTTDDPLVEFRCQDEVLLAPVSVLESWFRSDRGPRNLGLSLQEPDDAAKANGATAIVSMYYSSGAIVEIKHLGPVAGFFWRLRHRLGLH